MIHSMNHVLHVQRIVGLVHKKLHVEMEYVIQIKNLADIAQKIVANVQLLTIVGMDIVMDQENPAVIVLRIVGPAHQQYIVGT